MHGWFVLCLAIVQSSIVSKMYVYAVTNHEVIYIFDVCD